MAKPRHLSNAPIREAILDVRIKARAGFEIGSLGSLKETVEKDYPVAETQVIRRTRVDVDHGIPKEVQVSSLLPKAHWFRSTDGLQVFQAGIEGFTFNRLKPYTKWESFFKEGRRLWELYARAADPESIRRVGLRFINEIDLPEPIEDLSQYVTVNAPIAPSISAPMANFLSRTTLVYERLDAGCLVTMALHPDIKGNAWKFILDIDAFKEKIMASDGMEVWETIEKLRTIKNGVFFETITERLARRFD